MPLPGDQHKDTAATTNPFLEQKAHVTEYTAQEIATLQSRLEKQLGPEYISTRQGPGGGKIHYLGAEKVINLANEVFGFNGWSSAIQNVQIDFVDENPQSGKISLGLSTIVRVTLRDGTYHEDTGYGHIENCKGKAAAFEKAKKEAATDAMKRALRNFGNVLGNCLYDKDYLQKITKVKVAPSKWDADNLHRHPLYGPTKQEAITAPEPQLNKASGAQRQSSVQSGASYGSNEFDDDFGGNPFDETDFSHPDEVLLEDSRNETDTPAKRAMAVSQNGAQQRQAITRTNSTSQLRPPNVQPPQPISNPQAPQRPQGPPRPPNNAAQVQPNRMPQPQGLNNALPHGQQAPVHHQSDNAGAKSNPAAGLPSNNIQQQQQSHPPNQTNAEQADEHSLPAPRMPPPGHPEGFVTGRSVDLINREPPNNRPPNSSLAFNPHAESPSIRRTSGVNPGKSAPIMRQALNGGAPTPNGQPAAAQPAAQQGPGNGMNGSTTPVRTNFVNPSADTNRRIGMPPSAAGHPMQNRGGYKPPTALKRPPLTDVSNIQQTDGPSDAKKPRLDQPETAIGEVQTAAAETATT